MALVPMHLCLSWPNPMQFEEASLALQLTRFTSDYTDNGLPVQAYTLSQVRSREHAVSAGQKNDPLMTHLAVIACT